MYVNMYVYMYINVDVFMFKCICIYNYAYVVRVCVNIHLYAHFPHLGKREKHWLRTRGVCPDMLDPILT